METFILILKIIGILLVVAGAAVVFLAPTIVKKKNLDEKVKPESDWSDSMSEEELKTYKLRSAILSVKVKGIILATPGFILVLILFR